MFKATLVGALSLTFMNTIYQKGVEQDCRNDDKAYLDTLEYYPTAGEAAENLFTFTGTADLEEMPREGDLLAGSQNIKTIDEADYTLMPDDMGSLIVVVSAAGHAVIVPADLPAGFNCKIVQGGAGSIGITADAGVTVAHPTGDNQTGAENALAYVDQISADSYILSGTTSTLAV